MSYSGPPGVNPSHPSLPPRPPPAPAQAKPARFSSTFAPTPAAPSYPGAPVQSYPSTTSYSSAPTYGTTAPPVRYGASQPPPSYAPSYASGPVGGGRGGFGSQKQQSTYNNSYTPATAYGHQQQQQASSYGPQFNAPPAIRNPFPVPGEQQDDYDPEMAAQIAQWQSAYIPRDFNAEPAAGGKNGRPGTTAAGTTEPADATAANAAGGEDPNEPKKTVYRAGGGKKWADDTLTEWDPAHLRLFVGNLAGEVTDESLLKAFIRWKSVQKAKVVRDKRTTKSKGFGFVSFSDPDDFFQAAKEMNGKYIQSHPVVVRKSTTEIKVANVRDERKGGKAGKKNKANKSGNGNGGGKQEGGGYEPHLGAVGGGVHKSGQKTKGGLKLLG